jgi:phage-related protein
MNKNINISGWKTSHEYKKFDTVFFSGFDYSRPTWATGCLPKQSGYYYSETTHTSSDSYSPTGASSKWTTEFPSIPNYNSSVTFEGINNRIDFGDGYFSLTPKSSNNIKATYDMGFNGRTDRETKAISNFLESRSFEALSGAISGFTGFVFKPFYPYDKKSEHFCDGYTIGNQFNNVNDIHTAFIDEHNSSTDWLNRFIPSGNTLGLWEAGQSYSQYDTVYHSGGIIGTKSGCDGYYFFTGTDSTTASVANGPTGGATLWTNESFFFKPSIVSSAGAEIRFATTSFNNDFTQRANDGINTNNLKLNIILEGRSNKEAVAVSRFLLNKQAYQSFKFTPTAPHDNELNFICESWRHTYVFDENHRFELHFEQTPIDLSRKARFFKTMIQSENGELLAPYKPGDNVVTGIDFGDFMTGFSSGTGFYLVNSGDETIKSTLSLSGVQASSGLYKFVDQEDDRVTSFGDTSLIYSLAPGDSGRFEVLFSTTGHTGQIGENAGIGAPDQDISFHQGRIMYTDEPQVGGVKDSALTVSTTDEFLFVDPSGDLKIDLMGEAVHNKAPGTPINFSVAQIVNSPVITGGWDLPEPKTATGVAIYYSTNDAAAGDAGYTLLESGIATGVNTFTHEPVLPSTTYYYKVVAGNMDIVGIGTSVGRTFATCSYTANTGSALASTTTSTLPIHVSVSCEPGSYLKNVNIKTEADRQLTDYGLSNYDNFTGVVFTVQNGTSIISEDPSIPALDTDTAIVQSDGTTKLKLRLVMGHGTQIIGAGGKGADAMDSDNRSFAFSTKLSSAAKSAALPSTCLTAPQCRLGVIHELQGVGPIATRATKGISEGEYLLPGGPAASGTNTQPFNGEDGGTAFNIHSSYLGEEVEIDNEYGFIAGGGGGGGQGGVRFKNLLGMPAIGSDGKVVKDYLTDIITPWTLKHVRRSDASRFNPQFKKTHPSMLRMSSKRHGAGLQNVDFSIEVRAGGGGGGGAGFRKNRSTQTWLETAMGGKGCNHIGKYADKDIFTISIEDEKKYGIIQGKPSRPGIANTLGDILYKDSKFGFFDKKAGIGGAGSTARGGRASASRGRLTVKNAEDTQFVFPGDSEATLNLEALRNAGGDGGDGGAFGMDGHNGEHPQQMNNERFIHAVAGTTIDSTAEPRNYGYGGSGGLSIETNGCDLKILSTGNIPTSGLGIAGGHRSETDSKSSELYRNSAGLGGYLTPRNSGSAMVKEASDFRALGLISGMQGGSSNDGAIEGSDATLGPTYAAWKAFDQTINGDNDDHVWLTEGGFPYYLVYDFGVGNEQIVQSYSITSAGAGIDHYRTHDNTVSGLRGVYAPTQWELQASNSTSPFKDSNFVTLHRSWNPSITWSSNEIEEYASISAAVAKSLGGPNAYLDLQGSDAIGGKATPKQFKPTELRAKIPFEKVQEPGSTHLDAVPSHARSSHISVPGLTRSFAIPNTSEYRYYRLKILSAENETAAQCKIADFGLRARNRGYAGFITIRNKFT